MLEGQEACPSPASACGGTTELISLVVLNSL